MTAAVAHAPEPWFPSNSSNEQWAQMATVAPQLVSTMRRDLVQLTTFLAPRSVEVADQTLRQFARWLTTETQIRVVSSRLRAPSRSLTEPTSWDVHPELRRC